MGSLLLPSDTLCIYFGLHEFCMISLRFKYSTDIRDHFASTVLFLFYERLCLLKLSKRCLHDRGRANKVCTRKKIELHRLCAVEVHTMQTSVSALVVHATHIHRGSSFALCCITAPFPLSPTVLGRVPEGEIIHCRVCQRQGGGLSMGPPSLPCLGLPLLPARPFSSAWHSGDSCTEPEANLSLPHSPGKMISLSVLSTVGPRVLMR